MSKDRLLYLMIIDGKRHWLTITQAGKAYDSGWFPVKIGGQVMEESGKEREITDAERAEIARFADGCSGSK